MDLVPSPSGVVNPNREPPATFWFQDGSTFVLNKTSDWYVAQGVISSSRDWDPALQAAMRRIFSLSMVLKLHPVRLDGFQHRKVAIQDLFKAVEPGKGTFVLQLGLEAGKTTELSQVTCISSHFHTNVDEDPWAELEFVTQLVSVFPGAGNAPSFSARNAVIEGTVEVTQTEPVAQRRKVTRRGQ